MSEIGRVRVQDVLSTADIILLISGVVLLIVGALIGNITYGISDMVGDTFANVTGTTSNPFMTTNLINVGVFVFNMIGIVLIVAAAVHIISTLFKVVR